MNSRIFEPLLPWIKLTRMDLLIGPLLFFWPLAWSLTMVSKYLNLPLRTYAWMLLIGYIWSTLTHNAGCIWNDILDRELDRKVERTKHRPLAEGRVSVSGALVFLIAHLSVLYHMVLLLDENIFARDLGLFFIFVLSPVYPYLKRVTYWPHAWLGMAMNTGVPMAWAALVGYCPPSCMVLAVGAWSWTIWYDTIYACQDMKDDMKAGIKSTAILFGSKTKPILMFFGSLLTACLLVSGILNGQRLPYFVISVGGAAVHLALQLKQIDIDDPKCCLKAFLSNGFVLGGIVWAGLFLDYVRLGA